MLGGNVRSYRIAQSLSQEAFADVIGVHRTYVGAIERGEKNLSLRTVERLAERLDVAPLALLSHPGTEPEPDLADHSRGTSKRRRGRSSSG